ncbi:MAG: VOC family protein [Actinomycetales bacterium]|uniref:VOC family protein n=1 Tax=uncultured Salinibacterium sp. TaxID=459274 RepID=UPI0030DB3A40
MKTITPCLWFNGDAEEAATFYTSIFRNSSILGTTPYPAEGLADFQRDLAGSVLTIDFRLADQEFLAINAGERFPFNEALSFMVNFDPSRDADARSNLDALWNALIDGGSALMPIDAYDFSPRYGWLRDRFGVNWQLILSNPDGEPRPTIMPALLFGKGVQNRAREAMDFYASVFDGSQLGADVRYTERTGPAHPGSVMFGDVKLRDLWFVAMDAATRQHVTFTEAVSFSVPCADQDEIDRLWAALSAVPEAEACGWCKDKFGVSWQIIPDRMAELMARPGAFAALLEMKKLVIADF